MVQRGEFLERPTLIPVPGSGGDTEIVLEGLWHRGARSPPVLLLPPPWQEGGGMDHVVIAELAWACAQAGHASIRFNHRGVGASQGERGDARSQLEDAEAALCLLRENTRAARFAAVSLGGAWGAALALAERHSDLCGVGFVAPTPGDLSRWKSLSVPLLVLTAADDDRISPVVLSAAVRQARGTLNLVEGADAQFRRNLAHLGRGFVQWLSQASTLNS